MTSSRTPEADEVLWTSDRNRVVRRFGANGSLIWKEALEPGAAKRARHESTMLLRLAAIPGVAKLSAIAAAPGGINLEDDRGVSLAAILRSGERLALPALIDLAIALGETLAAVHRAGVVHRDVNPSNVLLVGPERRPVLIDFDIASSSAEERPAFATRAEIEGTLAYIAPEQTGRTGRVMDQRADLYALGATFYELATGRTPFGSDDSFDVVRDHLVRVATAPSVLDASVPASFSAIVMRLLEKEPDRRYQSAEGLTADLISLRDRRARGEHHAFALATSDFPQRLLPPSRLIGREPEIAELRSAFDDALGVDGRALFVGGAPGVGKSALIGELRAMATTSGGYFVSGKFDRYRQDVAADAVVRALRSLHRLLLAEPEAELVPLRERLTGALGRYAPSLVAITPELGSLLGIEAQEADESTFDEARLAQNAFDQLRNIASPARPVVFVLDDLQWAPSTAVRLVDVILANPHVPGLLFVGAYRAEEVDASHILTGTLERAKRGARPPRTLALGALADADLSALLAEMLRLQPARADALARTLGSRTDGNPYETVELVNGLRHDGLLTPGAAGWQWDDATIRRYVGEGDVLSRLTARIDALPAASGELLEIMACLGGDASASLLGAATGVSAATLDERAGPALEDGLAVFDRGATAFRFRHDRIQQAAYARSAAHRDDLHLTLARRLATHGERADIAAEQYLAAVDAVNDVDECATAIDLFRAAAMRARVLANYALAERFLTAARGLVRRSGPYDSAVAASLDIDAHATLYLLGRLEDADAIYATIATDAVDATCVQISSLTNRNRSADAVALGLAALRRLGIVAPSRAELDAHVDERTGEIEAWGHGDDTLPRAVPADDDEHDDEARVAAAAKIVLRMMPPAFFSDGTVMSWLVLESMALWNRHGPRAALVVPIAHTAQMMMQRRNDYRTGYIVGRRILETAERLGYEPEASAARFLGSLSAHCWFEPFRTTIELAHAAHQGLVRGGDLQNACFAYYASIELTILTCETLDVLAAESGAGVAFALRTGNHQSVPTFVAYRHLTRALRGEPDGEESPVPSSDGNPLGALHHHVARAQLAAFLDDFDALAHHIDTAMSLLAVAPSVVLMLIHPLNALASAHRIRTRPAGESAASLRALESSVAWLRDRAEDAADLVPMRTLVEAERAWALGNVETASELFEGALRVDPARSSPGHRAFLHERAGRFNCARGLVRYGRLLLEDARRLYEQWGATAKARALDVEFALSRGNVVAERRRGTTSGGGVATTVSSDAIDMIAILRASQALSSETTIEQLTARVGDSLAALTGATAVTLAVRRDDANDWVASARGAGELVSLDDPQAERLVPLAAVRYVRRTLEPLVLDDATRDDRVARDPYFAGRDGCSLLAVPISSQGALRAVVLLENSLGRGAFATTGLDAVLLIAGQLAVSLDNALLYASLERKVADRTEALANANRQLERLSLTDALTGLANRRAFDERLAAMWRSGLRADTQLGLIMIDIDEFKKYNDRYGHVAGDACLERVARTLGSGVRPESDFVARYGGEEFVTVVRAGPDEVASTAERLRASVAALAIEHASARAGIVTISLGVATFVPDASSKAATFLAAADAALYDAKRDGRNRVAYGAGATQVRA